MASRPVGINGGLPRRRNGKEQACEPCRKAKIACDHGLPVCSRCKRRKVTERCVYLSAPMTRPVGETNRRQSEPLTSTIITSANSVDTGASGSLVTYPITPAPTSGSSVVSPSSASGIYVGTGASHASHSQSQHSQSKSVSSFTSAPPKPGGFFGPTSFSAVFAENKESLGGANDDIQIINDREPWIPSHESLQSHMYLLLAGNKGLGLGEPRTALGAAVLKMLPDKNTFNFLMEWYFEKSNDSRSYKRTIMATAASLWSTFGEEMKEPRVQKNLEHVSSIISKNATMPLEESDDFDVWIDSITGMNLRWEALGGVCYALALSLLMLQERDAFFAMQRGSRTDRKNFACEMKDCLQACVTLSNYMDLLNILMVACLVTNLLVQTVISGDTSLICWRQLGDLVSTTTALGLHRQTDPRITFLSELKKYLFSAVFSIDKSASLLTGRPPALSYRYTKFQLPLDLDDDVVIRGGEELEIAISKLDANGWNTDGMMYRSTRTRAQGFLAIVLDEILELSLSDSIETANLPVEITNLLTRLESTYASFPAMLQFNMADSTNHSIPDRVFWARLCTRLHMLEHRLILERLAHKHQTSSGQSMIDCAREMLELVVLLWVQRDRFVERQCDYDWMLMCWGVPSSGVLCVELLKQIKQPAGTPKTLNLPRSEIVQNLSLLIGFLEWVRPSAGNYRLCKRMSLLIKRILDQILNPSPPSSNPNPAPSQETVQTEGTGVFESGSVVSGGLPIFDPAFDLGGWEESLDNLDWLNTVDWSRGPWKLDIPGGQDFSAAARFY